MPRGAAVPVVTHDPGSSPVESERGPARVLLGGPVGL